MRGYIDTIKKMCIISEVEGDYTWKTKYSLHHPRDLISSWLLHKKPHHWKVLDHTGYWADIEFKGISFYVNASTNEDFTEHKVEVTYHDFYKS